MHVQKLALVAVMSIGVAADFVMTNVACVDSWWFGRVCERSKGTWWNDHGQVYQFDSSDACRNPGVPGISNMCMDWSNMRLKFYPSAGGQRCIKHKTGHQFDGACNSGSNNNVQCYYDYWHEVPCDW